MSNPYQAPGAPLPNFTPNSDTGSLDAAVNGEYDFDTGEILREAWDTVSGAKGAIWGALFISGVISFVGTAILKRLLGDSQQMQMVGSLLMWPLTAPMYMGVYMMGVRRAAGMPIRASDVFRYLSPYNANVLFVQLATLFAIVVGFVLLIIPGIYLSISYTFAGALVVDKGLSPLEAMEASRKAVGHQWWKIAWFMFMVGLVVFGGFLLLGIGLIWAAPTAGIAVGILYRKMFGVTPDPGL